MILLLAPPFVAIAAQDPRFLILESRRKARTLPRNSDVSQGRVDRYESEEMRMITGIVKQIRHGSPSRGTAYYYI